MKITELSPIILFVYNRLWHTKQTIEALQNNILAQQSELFIYSDGKKKDYDKNVQEVRKYIRTINGFKSITIIEREKNIGLAANIIDGVTNIVNKYGKVIVLEDDIVTSQFFLQYMNESLTFYENFDKVMTISAYLYPMKTDNLPDTFLLKQSACWGWATWKESWAKFNNEINFITYKFTKQDIYNFNLDNTSDFWWQIIANKKGIIKTWAVFWAASMYLNDGMTLFPKKSLTKNIGHDSTGVHCGTSNIFNTKLSDVILNNFSPIIIENKTARQYLKKYFIEIKPSVYERIKQKINFVLKRIKKITSS